MAKNEQNGTVETVKSFIIDISVAVIIVLLVNSFVIQNLKVEGGSMLPLIDDGDMVLINKMIYTFDEPKRGDVIGFYSEILDKNLVKRVVALAGDKIEFIEDMLYVNDEPVISEEIVIQLKGDITYPYIVPEGTYFVVGDNYNDSVDSRYSFIGEVHKQDIIGRIDLKLWPFEWL